MTKSTAKAESWARDLKDRLEFRGYTVEESKTGSGWPRLTINTNEASIEIESEDAVSKDIFGNQLTAFAPHFANFASRADAIGPVQAYEIATEMAKTGIETTYVKTDATTLATAEATAGTPVRADIRWPTKGL